MQPYIIYCFNVIEVQKYEIITNKPNLLSIFYKNNLTSAHFDSFFSIFRQFCYADTVFIVACLLLPRMQFQIA